MLFSLYDEQEETSNQWEVAEPIGGPLDIEHAVLLAPFASCKKEAVTTGGK